jgi:hypothetical protein
MFLCYIFFWSKMIISQKVIKLEFLHWCNIIDTWNQIAEHNLFFVEMSLFLLSCIIVTKKTTQVNSGRFLVSTSSAGLIIYFQLRVFPDYHVTDDNKWCFCLCLLSPRQRSCEGI